LELVHAVAADTVCRRRGAMRLFNVPSSKFKAAPEK
jgi:hypothetical protein